MADVAPDFEVRDDDGTTGHFNGSVGASAISIPSVAANAISELLIQNISTSSSSSLEVSFDGGVNFWSLPRDSHLAWTFKGGQKQIQVKSPTSSSVAYQCLINFEEVD